MIVDHCVLFRELVKDLNMDLSEQALMLLLAVINVGKSRDLPTIGADIYL